VVALSTSAGVLLLVVLTAVSAFFSSSEVAVFSLADHRVETMEGRGVEALGRLRADPHRLLVTILVGNNSVNTAIAAVTTALLARSLSAGDAALVSTFVVGSVVLVFGETVPKSYGVASAESWSRRIAGPVVLPAGALPGRRRLRRCHRRDQYPHRWRPGHRAAVRHPQGPCRDGRNRRAARGHRGGQQALIERVFESSATTVADVMVPRRDVVAVDADGTVGPVNAAFGRSVLPGDDAETVAGLLLDAPGRPPERDDGWR